MHSGEEGICQARCVDILEVCGRGKVCGGMDGGECGRGVGVWWEGYDVCLEG